MKENMKSRKGIALAEAVIALVVIGIISVATLTVIFSSVQVENKTIVAMDVRNQAENAIECFRFAKGNRSAFINCLSQTEEEDFSLTKEEENLRTYVLDKGGYKTTITVTVKIEHNTEIMTVFAFKAEYQNSSDNKEIYSFEFPKASTEGGITE
jgi:type II secretory pathway pseudopilin PulG